MQDVLEQMALNWANQGMHMVRHHYIVSKPVALAVEMSQGLLHHCGPGRIT